MVIDNTIKNKSKRKVDGFDPKRSTYSKMTMLLKVEKE